MKYVQLCGLALISCSVLLCGCGGQSDSTTPAESTAPDTDAATDEGATSDTSSD